MIALASIFWSVTLAAAPHAPGRFDVSGEPSSPSIVFQLILTASLLAVGLYSVALRRKIAVLGNLAAIVTMIGMVLVWRPTLATAFALWLGIGRGADLIFYCWVVISMLMILNLHMKMRIQSETVTELIRKLAIAQPFAVPDRMDITQSGDADASDHTNPDGR